MPDVNTLTTVAHALGLSPWVINALLFLNVAINTVHHFWPDLTAQKIIDYFKKPPTVPPAPQA